MAYSRRLSAYGNYPVPGIDPGVISIHINNADSADFPVKVPWNSCRLAYAYTLNHSAIDNNSNVGIDLELGAGGSDIMSITITKNTGAGTVTEGTFDDESLARHLDNTKIINVEVDGDSSPSGAFTLFMYFEPDTD